MPPPTFSLGVIADIQYADMADSHVEGRTQRFRQVPAKLAAAVADLGGRAERGEIGAVLTLGDMINGNREDAALTPSDLETVAVLLDRLVREGKGGGRGQGWFWGVRFFLFYLNDPPPHPPCPPPVSSWHSPPPYPPTTCWATTAWTSPKPTS